MNRKVFWGIVIILVAGIMLRYLMPESPDSATSKRDMSYRGGNAKSPSGMLIYERSTSNTSGDENRTPDKTFVIDFGNKDLVADGDDSNNVDANNENVYMIQLDSRGRLIVNEKTRLAIERLNLMCTADELKEKLNVLPPDAQREVMNLVEYYDRYTRDISQLPTAKVRAETMDEALSALQELHNQRIMYFGNDVAKAFFEKEESTNRELLELVYREKANGM